MTLTLYRQELDYLIKKTEAILADVEDVKAHKATLTQKKRIKLDHLIDTLSDLKKYLEKLQKKPEPIDLKTNYKLKRFCKKLIPFAKIVKEKHFIDLLWEIISRIIGDKTYHIKANKSSKAATELLSISNTEVTSQYERGNIRHISYFDLSGRTKGGGMSGSEVIKQKSGTFQLKSSIKHNKLKRRIKAQGLDSENLGEFIASHIAKQLTGQELAPKLSLIHGDGTVRVASQYLGQLD